MIFSWVKLSDLYFRCFDADTVRSWNILHSISIGLLFRIVGLIPVRPIYISILSIGIIQITPVIGGSLRCDLFLDLIKRRS